MSNELGNPNWQQILIEAVSKPGIISSAYTKFWRYSTHNQLLAMWQCRMNGLEPGPINTYPGWLGLGRQVKRGQKAITLCQPIFYERKGEVEAEPQKKERIKLFLYRARWFVYCQTEGEPIPEEPIPNWDKDKALASLGITQIRYEEIDGNVQGFSLKNQVALNPIAGNPEKTLMHEIAHIILGHTKEGFAKIASSRAIWEVEAECTTYLVATALDLGFEAESRGYIQHWLKRFGETAIPEQSIHRIFTAADRILKAGRPDQNF